MRAATCLDLPRGGIWTPPTFRVVDSARLSRAARGAHGATLCVRVRLSAPTACGRTRTHVHAAKPPRNAAGVRRGLRSSANERCVEKRDDAPLVGARVRREGARVACIGEP